MSGIMMGARDDSHLGVGGLDSMSGPDVGGSFLGLHHGGGSPRATMLSSPGFCPTSSVSSYTAPPSWQLDHLPSAPPRSPSPSFQPSPIPPTFALPIESSQSLEAVVASYITGSLVAQLETDESAGESDSDVDAFVKDGEEYDDGLIVTREETEEDEETEDEMGGVQEEAYQMWTYEDSIEDASARGLPGVDMAQDHAPYGEYDDDDDEVAVAGYPLHGHYGVEQGREQYQFSYARAALEQPQEDGNDSDDSYVPEGDFESHHSRDTPPTSTSSDIDGKHDLENQATLPAPSAFIPALSYPRSAHLKKAYVNENARDDDEYNNSIASTSSSRSSSRTTRGLPVSSTGSEQTPRSKPKAKSKPRMMDDGEPITRKRTEIPAVEDDPSIKPYGCCYPPCFDDRTGMVESGVPRKVTPWETNFRTIKELREHVAAKHKSGKPVVETPFRCALDPCGKTFKSLAGLRWHFQNATTGHFLISTEEGETKPSKKFKPNVESNSRSEKCPIPNCSKAFKQSAGLAYHLAHATRHSVTETMFDKFGTKLKSKVKWWFSKKGINILPDDDDEEGGGGTLSMRAYVARDEDESGDDGDDGEWR